MTLCVISFLVYLGFTRQDYFTHFESIQSVDRAKTGDPREKRSLQYIRQNHRTEDCEMIGHFIFYDEVNHCMTPTHYTKV